MRPTVESKIQAFILHWNRPEECLKTVAAFQNQDVSISICVIDNASRLEKFELLHRRLPDGVELVRLEENKGWGGGHNVGLKRWLENETSEFCVVSAHDALPKEGCLEQLTEAMQANPEFGMVCPQYEGGEMYVFSPLRGPRILPCAIGIPGTIQEMDFIAGTLMLFRRACLKQIGLFDERYFAYGDEFDLALRARKHGWKVGMVYGAKVVNPETSVARPVVTYLCTRGTLLLARDHGGSTAATIRAGLILANTVRLLLWPRKVGHNSFHAGARVAAVRDFCRGRFGTPPPLE